MSKIELTPSLIHRFCSCVAVGSTLETAAAFCEVPIDLVYDWLELGRLGYRSEKALLAARLSRGIDKARADFEIETLTALAQQKSKKFQAVKFTLERRFAAQWSRRPDINAEAFLIKLKERLPATILPLVMEALGDSPAIHYPDPVTFCKEVLGINLWSRQADAARALTTNRRVAIKSGHKVGKSTLAAAIALWWTSDPLTRPYARVVITAPTDRQVKGIVWRELRRLYHRATTRGRALGGQGHIDPGTGLQWPDGREIVGFATDQAERIAGYSGEHLLFIADEASGVSAEIFEAIEGNRAGGGSLLMLGNPTRPSGDFYSAFQQGSSWGALFTISSKDTPNATGKGQPIPGLATAEYAKEKAREWGEDDPRYQIRVDGEFPDSAANTILPRKLLKAAVNRYDKATTATNDELVFGLDPARFGDDDPILHPRRGLKSYPPIKLPNGDGPTVGAATRRAIAEIKEAEDYEDKIRVCVDTIGIGASVFDYLKGHEEDEALELEVISVNVANTAREEEEYVNLRDELYFKALKWLKAGGALPNDPKLIEELGAHEYAFDSKGRCKVEPKEQIKKRIGRSPDRADAFILSLFERPSAKYTSVRGRRR